MAISELTTVLDIIAGLTGSEDNNFGLTEAQAKAKFDEGTKLLKSDINSVIGELNAETAADNIGCLTSYGGTIGAALETIFAAGTGTIPPDSTISTAKIQDLAVTEEKLEADVTTKLNAIKVKAGVVTANYTAGVTGVTINALSGNETLNAEQVFNIGFTPTAVLVFSLAINGHPLSTYVSTKLLGLDTGYIRERTDYTEKYLYGGVALTSDPMKTTKCSSSWHDYNVIAVETNGFRLYRREIPSVNDNDKYSIGKNGVFYYIAIG